MQVGRLSVEYRVPRYLPILPILPRVLGVIYGDEGRWWGLPHRQARGCAESGIGIER